MSVKLLFKEKKYFFHFLCFFGLFFSSINLNAQCAGTDGSTTICDITLASSAAVDLYSFLGGTPTTGGTWKDDNLSGGLNTFTGFLNTQNIKNSGVYSYTYTVTGVGGCVVNSAKIRVTVGGYTGKGVSTQACSDDYAYNLFQAFDAVNFLSPQQNGVWSDDSSTNSLTGYYLNANKAGVGTYAFTYTIAEIGTGPICTEKKSTVYVRVFPAADSGIGSDLALCSSDFLDTNFDLNSLLAGEDANGSWFDNSGTSELSSSSDNIINIENIYNNFGAGTYSFTYSVSPTNSICLKKSSSVSIIIEKRLDFTGATLNINSDVCEDKIPTASYSAVLTQVNQSSENIPNGNYDVTYTISGVAGSIKTTSTFTNGVLLFDINRSNFPRVGDFTVNVTSIINKAFLGICGNTVGSISDVLHIYPLPQINAATLTIPPVCKGIAAAVEISGNTNLVNGDYTIKYNLSGVNSASAQNATVRITGGVGNFSIPAGIIQNSGTTTISITNITNVATGCTNTSNLTKDFTILIKPDTVNLAISNLPGVCKGQSIEFKISGLGSLTNIGLDFMISGANTINGQIASLAVVSGVTSFTISASSLPNTGVNLFRLTSITNLSTGCITPINMTSNFNINEIPSTPIVTNIPASCKNDYKTVASLLPSGSQYQWYNSPTSTTVLSNTTLLVNGVYYVKEVNASNCESNRAMSTVVINDSQEPVLNSNASTDYCGLENPTLQNLSDNVSTSGTLFWFDSLTNGNQLLESDLLIDSFTYYGFNFSSSTNCFSENALAVTVSLSNCDPITYDFFIPDGFSPNGDNINDTFNIPNIEFIFPDFSLEIFNRYGNLMFTGNKNKPSWNGKNSDTSTIDGVAPNGVYFYVINFNKNNVSPRQGRLYLNR